MQAYQHFLSYFIYDFSFSWNLFMPLLCFSGLNGGCTKDTKCNERRLLPIPAGVWWRCKPPPLPQVQGPCRDPWNEPRELWGSPAFPVPKQLKNTFTVYLLPSPLQKRIQNTTQQLQHGIQRNTEKQSNELSHYKRIFHDVTSPRQRKIGV